MDPLPDQKNYTIPTRNLSDARHLVGILCLFFRYLNGRCCEDKALLIDTFDIDRHENLHCLINMIWHVFLCSKPWLCNDVPDVVSLTSYEYNTICA